MKTTTLLYLFLLTNCLASFAQEHEHGKMGLRTAIGMTTFNDRLCNTNPVLGYSLGLVILEKKAPFSVRGELVVENKGMYCTVGNIKTNLMSLSIYLLPQFKFKPKYKHTITTGIYASYILWSSEPDMGISLGYKYDVWAGESSKVQVDCRFNYGIIIPNKDVDPYAGLVRNAVAQVGLNFILGK